MVRSKVNLEYIANDSRGKSCFRKRRRGLIKKVQELSTLCGVDACAILFGENHHDPEVWPTTVEAQQVIADFRRMPHHRRGHRMATQESFTTERITKFEEKHKKLQSDSRQIALNCLMSECLAGRSLDSIDFRDAYDIGWKANSKIGDIARRIAQLKEENIRQGVTPMNGTSNVTNGAEVMSMTPEDIVPTHYLSPPMSTANQYPPTMDYLLIPNVQPGLGYNESMPPLPYAYSSGAPGPSSIYP
ncbi:hypothetical protein RJ639_014506 [Escallonia herrerae]|uniref:MADS-box domain-containing protein n=1 Tax=Escallonia herrerae TaxID=1293975 RepID=A0AA88VH56_9ASTE|nr:hypothetical protein RJ639_014506 [Escallonia herrerae]